ncbi:hypothetical protein NC653_018862 [Populus alba x Populus x berolinensis]|uniref:Uncharacterized protein n=1 Tax=Populus alba x Populus x berolinensis TaxID=444605 RepID=A0AAD6QHF4_9ROSI|nr:hypothetical protein NC653_018862 [Populus alba x Populus x berolinensis]
MQGFNCNLPKDWIANFQNIKDQNTKILNTRNNSEKPGGLKEKEEKTCIPLFSSQRNRGGRKQKRRKRTTRGEQTETEKKKTTEQGKLKQRRGSSVGGTTLPHRHLRLQSSRFQEQKTKEKRGRDRERGLIDKKPGGRRHCPARANSSPSPCSCTTPAALPHREHPSVLH